MTRPPWPGSDAHGRVGGGRRAMPGPKPRFICFPYAGGRASAYASWAPALSDLADLLPIEYPGRGRRSREPFATSMADLVSRLLRDIEPWLGRACVFFGHSMGALVAYEVTRALRRAGYAEPRALIVSGAGAPHQWGADADDLREASSSTPAMIELLRRHGGTPPEWLDDPELIDFVMPVLRADFGICDDYRRQYQPSRPLVEPLLILGGEDDRKPTPAELAGWADYTTGPTATRLFAGGHFFIRESEAAVVDCLAETLRTFATAGGFVVSAASSGR